MRIYPWITRNRIDTPGTGCIRFVPGWTRASPYSIYAEQPIPSKSDEQCVHLPNGRCTARWSLLSNLNLLCLMRGKAQLLLASQELLSVFMNLKCHLDPSICSLYWQHALLQALHNKCGKSPDILGVLLRAQKQHSFGPDICFEWIDGLQETVRHIWLAIWAKLPKFFQLTWNKLNLVSKSLYHSLPTSWIQPPGHFSCLLGLGESHCYHIEIFVCRLFVRILQTLLKW